MTVCTRTQTQDTPMPLRRPRRPPLFLVPVVWTLGLGAWGLSRERSMWRDEAVTWEVARRSTGDILRLLEHGDVVHGVHYLFMHGLFMAFGPGLGTLRLPSVLATAVAAGCVTVLGQRLGGTGTGARTGAGSGARIGLVAGLLLGLLPAVQFQLQEGRSFALVAAGAAVATLLLVRELGRPEPRRGPWLAYGTTVLLCGLLNWLSLLLLAAHLVTLLWVRPGRAVWRGWAAVAGVAVVGVAPLVRYSQGQSGQIDWIPPLTPGKLIGPAVLLVIGALGALASRGAGPAGGAAEAAGAAGAAEAAEAAGAAGARSSLGPDSGRRGLSVAAVGLPLLAVPQLGLIGLSLVRPVFQERYVLFSQLGLALLLGALADAAVRAVRPRHPRAARWLTPAVLTAAGLALLPGALAARTPAARVDDVLSAADEVRRVARDGDGVVYVPAARRDTGLVSPDAFTGLTDLALATSPTRSATLKGVEASPARIRAAMLARRRIVLVTDAGPRGGAAGERDRVKYAVLERYFTPLSDTETRGRRVTLYERVA
ncbi:hypothetical protein [Streptomyces sp. NPDC090025]|uniref:hypothetical protein n=1 Tax=Streptomyces sp. NPDC090025 TaxID=3365922 RepID=UPI003836B70F